jgi:hypothetical protein
MDLRKIAWIDLAQDRDKCRVLVSMVINLKMLGYS